LNLITCWVRQRTFVIIRLREIAHIEEPAAPLRLLSPGFGYLSFLGRSRQAPFGGDQNASICLVGKQSEQLRLFLVGLRKR
jgi:hypothetical protein